MAELWTTLAREDVIAGIGEKELIILEKALGDFDSKVDEALADVVALVRANIGACNKNTLGPSGTLPPSCRFHAVSIVVYRLMARAGYRAIPSARKESNDAATAFLRDIAGCRILIEAPTTAADTAEQPKTKTGILVHSSTPTRLATRATMKGL